MHHDLTSTRRRRRAPPALAPYFATRERWPVLCVALLGACAGYDDSLPEERELSRRDQAFETSLGGANPADDHHDITERALTFVFEGLREDLAEANEFTDDSDNPLDTKTSSVFHFDNCRVPEGFANQRWLYGTVINALNPDAPNLTLATSRFGTILHTSQDFYAHSNWIEGQGEQLVSRDEFDWPVVSDGSTLGSMMYFSRTGPSGASVRRANGSRVPYVSFDGFQTQTKGLMTGTYANGDGSACLSAVSIPHGPLYPNLYGLDHDEYLAKDAPGSDFHDAAVRVATKQTIEEFCRLDRLLRLRYGDPGHALLLAKWVADDPAFERTCAGNPGLVTALASVTL